jgi:hypothetical protein
MKLPKVLSITLLSLILFNCELKRTRNYTNCTSLIEIFGAEFKEDSCVYLVTKAGD